MRKNNKKISVCMAVYNGADFLKDQLDSILPQLLPNDEIIIVNDCSTDCSIEIIKKYNDTRIKVFSNPKNLGYVKSFEKAISLAQNEFIFLSDQDDIWINNRVDLMLEKLKYKPVVVGGTINFNNKEKIEIKKINSFYVRQSYIMEIFKSLIGYKVYTKPGCATAFCSDIRRVLLPFPKNVTYRNLCPHDLWLSLYASVFDADYYFTEPVLFHRIHNSNTSFTKRRDLTVLVIDRINRILCIIILFYRMYRLKFYNKNILS